MKSLLKGFWKKFQKSVDIFKKMNYNDNRKEISYGDNKRSDR
jgi:hypothetical protein